MSVATFLVAGCATPPENGKSSQLDQRDFNALDVKAVGSITQKRGDLLVVQTELKNSSPYDRTVFWRYRWFDKVGMQVGEETTWNPLLIYGQQTQYIKAVAPSPKADNFKIELTAQDTRGPK
jgi:uncharacterized protein YcfL